MNIPQSSYLHSQTFNLEFIEFVWQFPISQEEKNQIVFKAYKDGSIYLEEGIIDCTDEYKRDYSTEYKREYSTSGVLSTKNISFNELSMLKKDVVKCLNEL